MTPFQTVPPGPAEQFPGGTFLHLEAPSSDVDPGVGFNMPETEDPACTPRREEGRTETPEKEKEAEPGEQDARTSGREEPHADRSEIHKLL
ncbi:hypothetical protein NDU88_004631 [Pleurodeles waltl]|uniref:Uncharacterized protein n=1 Tax=Pleurodeles waltl TaxID=8319 RepID=A0AAV7T8B6_PLEWA|nr:hypothetical protein NDU88_004631 [Pleurodeles waltl]